MSNDSLYTGLYRDVINNISSPLLQHFESVFYNRGNSIPNSEGTPDISGYTLIFLIPPALSAFNYNLLPSSIITARNSIFQAIEFSPPETQINTGEVSSGSSIRIPFATSKSCGGAMSISYIDNMRLDVYALHNDWVHYIDQVLLGYIEPTETYIQSGELDYATSAFVMRFKPDLQSIVYLGKAVGIFPTNLPNKEIIGRRGDYTLTTFTVNYVCTDYREMALTGADDLLNKTFMDNNWIIADFVESVKLMYGDISLGNIGSMLLYNLNNPFMSMAASQASNTMF